MLVQGWYAATPTFPPTTNVGPTYLCYLCSDPKHKIWRPLILFTNSKHTRTWVRKGGGTLIFSYIRRPGAFLGLTFWCFVMTPKDIHKIFIPQKIFIFLKTLKGIEIQNFEPQNGASPRMNENIIVPSPPPSTLSSQIETGAGGVQTQITEKKTLIISNCPLPRHGLSFVGANWKSHKCFPCEHLKFQKIVVPGRVASD